MPVPAAIAGQARRADLSYNDVMVRVVLKSSAVLVVALLASPASSQVDASKESIPPASPATRSPGSSPEAQPSDPHLQRAGSRPARTQRVGPTQEAVGDGCTHSEDERSFDATADQRARVLELARRLETEREQRAFEEAAAQHVQRLAFMKKLEAERELEQERELEERLTAFLRKRAFMDRLLEERRRPGGTERPRGAAPSDALNCVPGNPP